MNFRSVQFDAHAVAPAEAEGDFVIRSGKYFEVGVYPDKEFALTEDEADVAILSFEGAPINLEHTQTLFDGKLGRVRRIWRTGKDIFAEYAIPLWLHRVTGGAPLKISSEWDRETHRPVAAALVLSPRIQDAVMMAESAHRAGIKADAEGLPPSEPRSEPEPSDMQQQSVEERKFNMSLLGRLASFLKGEGLLDANEAEPESTAPTAAAAPNGAAAIGQERPVAYRMAEPHVPERREGGPTEQRSVPLSLSVPASGAVIDFRSSAEYRRMAERLEDQENVIRQLQAQFALEQEQATFVSNNAEIDSLIRQGRMTAGEGDNWREIAREHPEAFSATLTALRARTPLSQFGEGRTRRITPDPEDPGARIVALTRERVARTAERYETAFSTVCRENAELAAQHAAGAPRFGGVVHE